MSIDLIYDTPGHLIRRAQQIATALFAEICAEEDLTSVQYAALLAIRETPGIDATRLSALIAFDRSTLGDVLERLESKGLLGRRTSRTDKRVKLLELTEAGQALLHRAEPKAALVQERILAPLAATDRATLMRLLAELVDLHRDQARTPPAPLETSE